MTSLLLLDEVRYLRKSLRRRRKVRHSRHAKYVSKKPSYRGKRDTFLAVAPPSHTPTACWSRWSRPRVPLPSDMLVAILSTTSRQACKSRFMSLPALSRRHTSLVRRRWSLEYRNARRLMCTKAIPGHLTGFEKHLRKSCRTHILVYCFKVNECSSTNSSPVGPSRA